MTATVAKLPIEITTADLIQLTGVPRRTISHWTTEGAISPNGRGTWPTTETIRAIIGHLRTQQGPANARGALLREQTRIKRLQADSIERTVIQKDEAREGWLILSGMFVAALDGMPGRLAIAIANASEPAEVRRLIRAEVNAIRTELADALEKLDASIAAG